MTDRIAALAEACSARVANRSREETKAVEESLRAFARFKADRRRRRAEQIGIPGDAGLQAVALCNTPPETHALAAFREAVTWLAERGSPIVRVVGGSYGCGKSAGMAWAMMHADALGDRCAAALWTDAADIEATLRNGYSENEIAWERWASVSVLGIDDAGTGRGDPLNLVELLARRCNRGLVTLVTTNLNRDDFGKRYPSPRLADRIGRGMAGTSGLVWFVWAEGESLRDATRRQRLWQAKG